MKEARKKMPYDLVKDERGNLVRVPPIDWLEEKKPLQPKPISIKENKVTEDKDYFVKVVFYTDNFKEYSYILPNNPKKIIKSLTDTYQNIYSIKVWNSELDYYQDIKPLDIYLDRNILKEIQ